MPDETLRDMRSQLAALKIDELCLLDEECSLVQHCQRVSIQQKDKGNCQHLHCESAEEYSGRHISLKLRISCIHSRLAGNDMCCTFCDALHWAIHETLDFRCNEDPSRLADHELQLSDRK